MKRFMTLIFATLLLVIAGIFIHYDLINYANLHSLKAYLSYFQNIYTANPTMFIIYYALIFLVASIIMAPFSLLLILLGGAVISPLVATIIGTVSLGIGNSITFICVRYFCYDWIISHFKEKLSSVNRHLKEDGFFYVVFIRFIPGIPLFFINILLAVTEIKLTYFFFGTMIGAFFPFYVFSKTARTLSTLSKFSDLYTTETVYTFLLLGVLALGPILYKNYKRITTK
jgi:uncharacterized membrane protein YdjX (TVP38/TMEM64 family)